MKELVESLELNVKRSSEVERSFEVENREFHKEEAFVIGGGMVYRQMMPLADKLYITHIHHSWEDADTFFPEIKEDEWELTGKEDHQADEKNPYAFTFAEYVRKIKN